MSFELSWQLPARGDGRYGAARSRLRGESNRDEPALQPGVSDPRGRSFGYFDYLHQVARAAALSGFDGVRIQHDTQGDEAWIIAGYIARGTRTLKLITEFEASWGSAVYAAKNAVSFQRYSGGRFAWQLSVGAEQALRQRDADPVPDEQVLARIEEFLTVARGVSTTAPFSFEGKFFQVRDGGFKGTLAHHPVPEVYLSGTTTEALELSARQADVHVLPGLPVEALEPHAATLRQLAGKNAAVRRPTPLALGTRLDVLARETRAEAVFDASRHAEQSGVARPADGALLWPGLTTRISGAEATLVGSYAEITAALGAYASAGISRFLLGCVPHLEEAYRFGSFVLPALRRSLAALAAA